MEISKKVWKRYIDNLDKINSLAKDKVVKYIETHDISTDEGRQALIDYCYAISIKYGEAAAEFACQFYDSVTDLEGVYEEPAEPAETADYSEVCKAVNGTMKYILKATMVSTAVARLVKQAGQDTTLKNAIRDRAYFAWIPAGDTCPYCLSIAAEGWRRASQSALEGGHAEHIHGNCTCSYAIKHEKESGYASYHPEEYQEVFETAEGTTEKDKINAIRRANYAEEKDEINEQKRMAYAEREEILKEEEES